MKNTINLHDTHLPALTGMTMAGNTNNQPHCRRGDDQQSTASQDEKTLEKSMSYLQGTCASTPVYSGTRKENSKKQQSTE